jgi:sugar lactone lactonase YvrE
MFFAALTFLVGLVVLVSSAIASVEPTDEQTPSDPPQLTDSQLAEALPHSGLDRSEVIELVAGVFDVQLQSPAGPFDDLDVNHFISDSAAVIESENRPVSGGLVVGEEEDAAGGELRLLESSFPLRRGGEAIDLSLTNAGDSLEPLNPITDVELPAELGDPIALPELGIGISLVGAPADLAPSRVENTALYPNVAPDTDFVAAPTPTGVETMITLRSAAATPSQVYSLDLPKGAVLHQDGGGASVEQNGNTALRIEAPTALDANGKPVSARLAVEGNSIEITAIPEDDTAYPVLVDPFFESYTWSGGSNQANWNEWFTESSNTPGLSGSFEYNPGTAFNGFRAVAQPGSYSPGNFYKIMHEVPRYRQEKAEGKKPTSYFTSMTLSNVRTYGSGGTPAPYASAGIWDVATNYFAGQSGGYAEWSMGLSGGGISGATITITGAGSKEAKLAQAAMLKTNENATVSFPGREMYIGGATFEIADEDDPVVTNGSASSAWADQVSRSPIEATLSDKGLGAKRLRFEVPGQAAITRTHGCAGSVSSPCPAAWRPTIAAAEYNASVMPQGWLSIPVTGEDVLGRKSNVGFAEIGVDHTAPSLSTLSGSLTQQATLGTHKLQYGLSFSGTDGFEVPAAVEKTFGSNGSGNGQFKNPFGVAIDNSGAVYVVDMYNNRIEKFDQQGNYLGQFGNTGTETEKLLQPRMIAVAPNGNLWVTDTGNQRLAQYTPGGAYVRQFKDSTLPAPFGIASAPGGFVWFTDFGSDEVVKAKQNADGSLSTVFKVKGITDPGGLAADAAGNVWVADTPNARLQKVTAAGYLSSQVGGQGSSAGRFDGPFGVAITGLGHLLVADSNNNRIQLVDTQGDVLRVFSQGFNSPKGLVVGPGNTAFITDWGNHRIQKWSNVDLDSQSGIVKSEVLVDGQVRDAFSPACSGQPVCAIPSRTWTLNAREFTEGNHTVEVALVDAVGLRTVSAPLNFDLHPDRTAPQLTLGGSMTEQAGLGSTRPTYKLKITATDPEPKEGSFAFETAFGGMGGPSSEGKFELPNDADVDTAGNVWVADTGNDRVEKFSGQGQFLKKVGSYGTGAGQLRQPAGITMDPSGNAWVADTANNRIVEFNSAGSFVAAFGKAVNKTKVESGGSESEQNSCTAASGNTCQAGSAGSAGLQFNGPAAIAATSGGNLWIADTGNNRLVKMSPSGSLINTLSTLNAELGKLSEPRGIEVAADGSILAVDTGNDRVAQWNSSLVFVRKIGAQGAGFGQFNYPSGIDLDAQGNIWIADGINRRVQQFSSTGQYLMGYGSGNPAGDTLGPWMPRGLVFGPQNALYVVDYMNRRVQRWAPSAMSQSGVVSSSIKVDGKVVDSYNPGCPAENCPLTREWTMTSDNFAPGAHTVEATVTDGSGLSTTKSLSISIQRDTTAPQLVNSGPLADAPEGWVEQKSYSFIASATDPGGYGVKQIRLTIDGAAVDQTIPTSCEGGGCAKVKVFNVNAAQYDGGAHAVTVTAEDGAGNWKNLSWTMNVDPSGAVSSGEATDTLEAMEETVPAEAEFEPVGSTLEYLEQQLIEAGDNPHFKMEEGQVVSTGVTTDTEINPVSDTITSVGTEGPLEITPDNPVAQPEVVEGAAAVLPSSGVAADTVVRPEYNGLQMFTTIREYNAPTSYGWHVNLNPGQYLVQVNEAAIEVHSKTGAVAWLISAEFAHDATGKPVETSLSLSGTSDFDLTVQHRVVGVTYPVSAGSSYETGYAMVTVWTPPEEETQDAIDEEEANDPITFEELTELNAETNQMVMLRGTHSHRDPNKPIKRRQARKMIRAHKPGTTVPPPASALNGPGASERVKYVPMRGHICSNWECGIWQIEFDEGSFSLGYSEKTGRHWAAISPFGDPSNWSCSHHVDDWWTWNIDMDLGPDGYYPPTLVYKGSGQHLTFFCEYNVAVFPLPEAYIMDQDKVIELWAYPNGYAVTHNSDPRGIKIFES